MDAGNFFKYFFNSTVFSVVFLCVLNTVTFTQEPHKEQKLLHPRLQIEADSIDYSTILQNSNTTKRIKITNDGDIPLRIFNVRSSCGISIPSWPRQPIEPGDEAFIQIRYDSSNPGPINRNLIIHSNSPENTKIIKIKGYVVPEEK